MEFTCQHLIIIGERCTYFEPVFHNNSTQRNKGIFSLTLPLFSFCNLEPGYDRNAGSNDVENTFDTPSHAM